MVGAATYLGLKGQRAKVGLAEPMGAGMMEDAASLWCFPLAELSGSVAQGGLSGGAQGRAEKGE